MSNPPNKGKGVGIRTILAHVDHNGEDCLIWPMTRIPNGYGTFSINGKMHYAHRYMCELVNGPPSSPSHEAAHSCGRGHDGCFNPKHLSWKTTTENMLDSRRHGTIQRARNGCVGVLTEADVSEIRALKGRAIQSEIAKQYGVSDSTIRDIFLGRSHSKPRKLNVLPADLVTKIRNYKGSDSYASLARRYGIRAGAVRRIRLGLTYKFFVPT